MCCQHVSELVVVVPAYMKASHLRNRHCEVGYKFVAVIQQILYILASEVPWAVCGHILSLIPQGMGRGVIVHFTSKACPSS